MTIVCPSCSPTVVVVSRVWMLGTPAALIAAIEFTVGCRVTVM